MHILTLKTESSWESSLRMLCLESATEQSSLWTVRDFVPNAIATIKETFSIYRDQDELAREVRKAVETAKPLMKRLGTYRFVDYTSTLVTIPTDFQGDFVEYLSFLNKASPEIQKVTLELLQEFYVVLSSFLNLPKGQVSTLDHTNVFVSAAKVRKDFANKMRAFFSEQALGKDKTKLQNLIGRFGDIEPLVKEAQALEKHRINVPMDRVQRDLNRCVEQLTMVHRRLETMDPKDMNRETAENLMQGAREIALMVELAAMYRYHGIAAIGCVARLVEQLDRIIE